MEQGNSILTANNNILFHFHCIIHNCTVCVKEVLSNSTEGQNLQKLDKTSWTDVVLAYFSINSKSAYPKFCQKYCLSKNYSYDHII